VYWWVQSEDIVQGSYCSTCAHVIYFLSIFSRLAWIVAWFILLSFLNLPKREIVSFTKGLSLGFCYHSRYWWQQVIHLGQLPVTSWRYGLKELDVRLLWLKERSPNHHQIDNFCRLFQSLKVWILGMATKIWSWSVFQIVLSQAVKKGKEQEFEVVLCGTSDVSQQIFHE